MWRRITRHVRLRGTERGQASVEFLGTLPAVLLAGLVVWQLALTGHTAWLCANAARVAARAHAVERDPEVAARSALPEGLRRRLEVSREGVAVRVRVRVPLLLHRWRGPIAVGASASLPQGP